MVRVNMKFSVVFKSITDTDVATIDFDGENIGNLLTALIRQYGTQFEKRVIDENTGKLRRFVNIFVNGKDIRNLQGSDTKLNDGDEVRLIPAVAGGFVMVEWSSMTPPTGAPLKLERKLFPSRRVPYPPNSPRT